MTTEQLLSELRGSRTDLARLVAKVDRRRISVIVVPPAAVAEWNRREPLAWTKVHEWLVSHGVEVLGA